MALSTAYQTRDRCTGVAEAVRPPARVHARKYRSAGCSRAPNPNRSTALRTSASQSRTARPAPSSRHAKTSARADVLGNDCHAEQVETPRRGLDPDWATFSHHREKSAISASPAFLQVKHTDFPWGTELLGRETAAVRSMHQHPVDLSFRAHTTTAPVFNSKLRRETADPLAPLVDQAIGLPIDVSGNTNSCFGSTVTLGKSRGNSLKLHSDAPIRRTGGGQA